MAEFVIPLDAYGKDDEVIVGGKNASLGEMLGARKAKRGRLSDGLAVMVAGYRESVAHNGLDGLISVEMEGPA